MECSRPKRHALDRSSRQRPEGTTHVVLVPERAFHYIGQTLHVAMGVEGPNRTGDQSIVVEDPHRAEAIIVRVAVSVEREVPPSSEPAAFGVVDVTVSTDQHHLDASLQRLLSDPRLAHRHGHDRPEYG